MNTNHTTLTKLPLVLYLSLFLLSAGGCGLFSASPPPADAPIDSQPTPPSTPKPPSTAADTISSNPQPTGLTLTLWATEHVSSQSDLLTEQITRFEQANPTTQVKLYLKKDEGQADIISYLKSAQAVAPGILPDVAILSTSQMPTVWRAGLIQPLDGEIDRTITQDLLPAAQKLGTIDGQLVGIPFEIDVEHPIYNTKFITATPVLWTDVISNNIMYTFPGKGLNGLLSDATLTQYLSAGGRFIDEAGNPIIDGAALRQVLAFYQTMLNQSLLQADILDIVDTNSLWEAFQNGDVGLMQVSAHNFLTNRKLMPDAQPLQPPTQAGNVVSVGHGWVFVLITNDPVRRQQALGLIETFLQTDVNATWALRSESIPARQTAFNRVANDDPYWAFLNDYLTTIDAPPTAGTYAQTSRIMQNAVEQVLKGNLSPDEATQAALTALQQ